MSNHKRFWAKVLERRRKGLTSHSNAHLLAYLKSELIVRLAAEVGYSPRSPVAFANSVRDRASQSSQALTERLRATDRAKQLRDKYAGIEAEQQLILETADPYRVSMETIGLAQQKLEQCRWFLDRIPEASSQKDRDISDEDYRAREIETLKAWRSRLRTDEQRIVGEINGLDPQSINLESVPVPYGVVGRLLDELDSVTRAIDDAGENLKIANGGKPVPEYPIGASG